jgi:hypothetical protein
VSQGSETLLLSLMIGAIFWNYLSVVFSQANQWFGGRTRTSRRLGLSGHPNQKSVQ